MGRPGSGVVAAAPSIEGGDYLRDLLPLSSPEDLFQRHTPFGYDRAQDALAIAASGQGTTGSNAGAPPWEWRTAPGNYFLHRIMPTDVVRTTQPDVVYCNEIAGDRGLQGRIVLGTILTAREYTEDRDLNPVLLLRVLNPDLRRLRPGFSLSIGIGRAALDRLALVRQDSPLFPAAANILDPRRYLPAGA